VSASVPGVVDVIHVRGAAAKADAPAKLVVEVPHGATKTHHFTDLRAQLKGPFPDDLIDFFYVNTDVGAPEAALALAHHVTAKDPAASVTILHCQIPRTFIDCNRVIDEATRPGTSEKGGMTPGVVRYVTDADDLKVLFEKYRAYRASLAAHITPSLEAGGTCVMLHTYAPRSVDVPVDENIVQSLHKAYEPDVEPTWPLRPEVDLITTTPEGKVLVDDALVKRVVASFAAGGVTASLSGTYPLHPSTGAYEFAVRFPSQTLCLELRRDLVVEKFTPFAEMKADAAKVARMGLMLGDALLGWWSAKR
jgi:hypothetical protein